MKTSIWNSIEIDAASRDFSYQDYLNLYKVSTNEGAPISEISYILVCDILNLEMESPLIKRGIRMNLEVESYEGELKELRKFRKEVNNYDSADVWHEGSQSFYRALLIKPLTKEEALNIPYG